MPAVRRQRVKAREVGQKILDLNLRYVKKQKKNTACEKLRFEYDETFSSERLAVAERYVSGSLT